jgi:FtsH-binding integral membrane protein
MSEDSTQETAAPGRIPRGRPSVIAARVMATAVTVLFVVIGLSTGLDERAAEVIVLFGLIGVAVVCVLVAWVSAALGARALLLAGIALAVFFAIVGGDDKVLLALIFGGPYLLSALLLWFGALRLARS